MGGVENAVILCFDQDVGPHPQFVFDAFAKVLADVAVDLLFDAVSPFVKCFGVLYDKVVQSAPFSLFEIALQHHEGQHVAHRGEENAKKQCLEWKAFHLVRASMTAPIKNLYHESTKT
jgi:hypothetical protein